jgi:4-amino-4-deoxy-L-arabinose transferase-like glycosyltransferase
MEEFLEKRKNQIKKTLFGWVKDNYDKLFIAVLIIAFAIRILVFVITKDQCIWWDAADYLATAKRWAGINPNLIDLWYYRRGFLWPLLASLFFRIGLGDHAIRFFVVLLSTGIVAVSYFLIKKMFNKKLALLVAAGVTFSWIYLFFTGRPLTNLPATFFLLTFLLFFWKGYVLKEGNKFLYLSGIFLALSVLIRMQYLMFVIPILILIFTKEKFRFLTNKKLWITLAIFLLILTPQLIMHGQHFGNPIADLSKYYLGIGASESGEVGGLGDLGSLSVYFTNLPYILDGNNRGYSSLFTLSPIYLLFVIGFFYFFSDLFLGFDKIFKNEKIQKRFFILIWIISTFIFLGYIAPHLEQRYMMQTLPFLFLIAVSPLPKIINFISKKFKLKKSASFFIIFVILLLLLIPNIIFGYNLIEAKKTSYLEVKQSGEWIKENSNPEDIIISSSFPQTTYYAERSSYPFHLGYRRDITRENISETEKFIQEQKPKYLVMSIFEPISDFEYWANYPQMRSDIWTPVQVYTQGEQPVLIIYEANYSKS